MTAGGTAPADVSAQARKLTVWHYQWIVLHDFLDRIVDFNDVQDVLTNGRRFFTFEATSAFHVPFMPVESAPARSPAAAPMG
jgi:hypothetical protein